MAFVKREIKDRVVQYPRRYQLVEVQPGIFDLVPVTGTVTEEGTPVNKELLQRYEDGLDAALEKTGDGKDVIVTFTEAATEAHITSGEKLSVMFGKILKMFKGKAPNNHASSADTYGVGTTANFGHCKTINNLTQASHVNGNALSAYQGKVLVDLINQKIVELKTASRFTGSVPGSAQNFDLFTFDITTKTSISISGSDFNLMGEFFKYGSSYYFSVISSHETTSRKEPYGSVGMVLTGSNKVISHALSRLRLGLRISGTIVTVTVIANQSSSAENYTAFVY